MKRPLAILLLVIMVLPPTARAGQVAARAANAVGDNCDGRAARSARRPIDDHQNGAAHHAGVALDARHRRCAGHHAVRAARSRQDAGNDFAAGVGATTAASRPTTSPSSAISASSRRSFASCFPGEAITATSNGKDVVLSGVVSSKYIVDRASSLAVGLRREARERREPASPAGGAATNQVLLRVRFAEVSRSAMQELGAAFFTGPNGKGDWIGRATTQQYPAPVFDKDKGLVFSDFLNLFLFNTEEQLGAVIRALKGKGLFQSLAEPNLITQDGKEASFLAGGEYPYPVVQGSGANAAVTIVFKEFGVRLRFTPTVTADGMIQLKVAPEVSSLDFGNAVVLQGFRVPALATRRTETSRRASRRSDVRHRRHDRSEPERNAAARSGHSATSRSSAICSAARRIRRTRPSSS